MLLIARKPGEAFTLQIGDIAVRVVLLDIREGRVNLGIDAPAEVRILRDELMTDEKWAQIEANYKEYDLKPPTRLYKAMRAPQ